MATTVATGAAVATTTAGGEATTTVVAVRTVITEVSPMVALHRAGRVRAREESAAAGPELSGRQALPLPGKAQRRCQ
jgi:hypothetical protein